MGTTIHRKYKIAQLKALGILLLSIWTAPVMALDLGRLQILSGMGEPLRAEVEITQASPNDLSTLRAQLAAPSVFGEAGMEFNPALDGVTATLQKRSNGSSFIALSGTSPVKENFIDLILETQWATGRLVKNYALLLNSVSERTASTAPTATSSAPLPIRNSLQASQAIAAPTPPAQIAQIAQIAQTAQIVPPAQFAPVPDGLNASSVSLNAQNVPVYRFDPIDNATAPSAPTNAVFASPAARQSPSLITPAVSARPSFQPNANKDNDGSIQVMPGDTASRLALRFIASNVSMDQMLLAMLKANPNAFIQGNVNLVKAGATLRMPSQEEALQIPRTQARSIVLAQTRDFAAYARRLAQSALLVDGKNSREMSGKVGQEKPAESITTSQQDKLTLSKSSIESGSAEAALAASREAKDSNDQLASLNKNLQDLEALINGQPARTVAASAEAASTATTPTGPAIAPAGSNAGPEANANTPANNSTAPWLQNLQDNKQLWAWAGAFLALILLFVFWIRRKSSEPETVYSPSYDDIPATSTDPVMDHSPANSGIHAQMSAIDLNLQSPPPAQAAVVGAAAVASFPPQTYAATNSSGQTAQAAIEPVVQAVAPAAGPSNLVDTEQSKLNLAAQLLAKGDKDLARALILSVISSSTGELKARAIQLLGQIR